MANKTQTILIESILGGQSPLTHFSASDQFQASIGINPSAPVNDLEADYNSFVPSGLLRPTSFDSVGSTAGNPMWMVNPPWKNSTSGTTFIYDSVGSVYTFNNVSNAFTSFGDLTDGGTSSGNGCAYYDNYVYFARDTTIARYGPLTGFGSTSAFTDDYWVGTLGKTALTNTTYPNATKVRMSNHILHRHSDGKLYILDVLDNTGTIHYIKTKKTTVEGDTDDGSTYDKLHVGYGLHPTAIESYGEQLVIAFAEISTEVGGGQNAKIAFWDTTSEKVNQITWAEFPDPLVTALKNVNGVLYAVSSKNANLTTNLSGIRVSRYIGGSTFEQVAFISDGVIARQGAVDGASDYLLLGSSSRIPVTASGTGVGCIRSVGLTKGFGSGAVFTPYSSLTTNSVVTCLSIRPGAVFNLDFPLYGVTNSDTTGTILRRGTSAYNMAGIRWWSRMFSIGAPFKITKIRIPLAKAIGANMSFTPKFYMDEGTSTQTLVTVSNTNYSGEQNIVIKPNATVGKHNFWLELDWTGSALCVVSLPITIEYEILND